jgi:hypothetical protein
MTHEPDRHEMLLVSYRRATARAARLELWLAMALATACILGAAHVAGALQSALGGGS